MSWACLEKNSRATLRLFSVVPPGDCAKEVQCMHQLMLTMCRQRSPRQLPVMQPYVVSGGIVFVVNAWIIGTR